MAQFALPGPLEKYDEYMTIPMPAMKENQPFIRRVFLFMFARVKQFVRG